MGSYRLIANLLGLVVAIMGVAFIYVAFRTNISSGALLSGLKPVIAEGALPLVIGLIGTTIVPYNLFLASGISQGQDIREMRWGISVAVLIGGVISIAIMVVGTSITGVFSFERLSAAMAEQLGAWSIVFFGLGLFAAGLSSSITAPMAAAVTAQSLFGGAQPDHWSVRSRNFRLVWGTVLAIGLLFGLLEVKPIPAILLAQVINGVLLPIVTIFLILAVNDRDLLPATYVNRPVGNVLSLFIVGVTCFLGLNNIWKAFTGIVSGLAVWEESWLYIDGAMTLGLVSFMAFRLFRRWE